MNKRTRRRTMLGYRLNACCFAIALLSGAAVVRGAPLPTGVAPFLQRHCFECHSGDAPEAGLNLEKLSRDLADADVRRRWVYLYDRVAGGEMPPKSADQPDAESKAKFLQALGDSLARADRVGRQVVLRRLNRREYQHTVCDLFGIDVDLGRLLPDDRSEQGFDTTGSALSLSAEQLVLYVEAADLVLDQVFGPSRKPASVHKTWNAKDSRALRASARVGTDGIVLFNTESFVMRETSAPLPGTYRLRFQARTVQSGKPLVVQVDGGISMQIAPHVEGFFEVPPGGTTTIELTGRAVERFDSFGVILVGGFPFSRVPEDYGGPGVFIGDIEFEGPLEPWPPPARARLLGDVDPQQGTLDDVRAILLRLLPSAFRRATKDEEVEPFVALARQALDEGLPCDVALRRGLKGVLCAPEFLFLEEPLVPGEADAASPTIDDEALATRLSYLLWSSLPDAELLSLAHRGQLHPPTVLRAQVERMLADPRSDRFVESFTDQWLRLRDIDFTVPDQLIYPEYNQLLRRSMLDETRAFFRELLVRDESVQNFIDSYFVTVNGPLAEFYGIEGVEGLATRRVDLPEDSLRGGVLTQASVLKVSADGTRTSPVLRGAWILKNFFGTPSPPPPPTVKAIEPDIRGATTIREQLARHRSDPSCSRCHRKLDPPGFALESFDVIGAQRDWYRTRGAGKLVNKPRHPQIPTYHVLYRRGPDVDASGTMPDGRTFAGIRDYKRLLLADETGMPRALTRILLTYAVGRNLGFSDREDVERIVARLKEKHYGLRSMIHEIVQSRTFRSP